MSARTNTIAIAGAAFLAGYARGYWHGLNAEPKQETEPRARELVERAERHIASVRAEVEATRTEDELRSETVRTVIVAARALREAWPLAQGDRKLMERIQRLDSWLREHDLPHGRIARGPRR